MISSTALAASTGMYVSDRCFLPGLLLTDEARRSRSA
jgi:hypothetical protein